MFYNLQNNYYCNTITTLFRNRMNGTLKGFLRLCPRACNWTVLSNYIVPLHAIQKVSRNIVPYSTYSSNYSTSLIGN